MELETKGVNSLIHRELSRVQHCQDIVDLLKKAMKQFEAFNSPRSKSRLTVTMAEELKLDGRFQEALELLEPVAKEYRLEGWTSLVDAVNQLSIKCAYLMGDAQKFVRLLLDLSSRKSGLTEEDKNYLMAILILEILEGKNPNLKWEKKAENWNFGENPLQVTLEENLNFSCIEINPIFEKSAFKADEKVKFRVEIRTGSGNEIPIGDVRVKISGRDLRSGNGDEIEKILKGQVLSRNFEFAPMQREVGEKIQIDEISLILSSKIQIEIIQKFAKNPDGAEIVQRDPKIRLELVSNPPILIGEWFKIRLRINKSDENSTMENSRLRIELMDSGDPLIGDTTKLSFDPREIEKMKNVSIDQANLVQIEKILTEDSVDFYMKSSIEGQKRLRIGVSYRAADSDLECRVEETTLLESIDPLEFESKFLSLPLNKDLRGQVFADEPFLLNPRMKSLSPHPIVVRDTFLDLKSDGFLRKSGNKFRSQLKNCELQRGVQVRESHSALVKKEDLIAGLDSQEMSLGKYLVKWRRKDSDIDAETAFDLSDVKVALSGFFAKAVLPAFGAVRTPLNALYELTNSTDKVQEFSLSVEPSESFMLSGNKQLHFKILPQMSYKLSYVLYPLIAGESVALPALKLTPARVAQGDVSEALERLLPKTIAVMPKLKKGGDNGHEVDHHDPYFAVTDYVKLENDPFTVGGKMKVVKA